MILQSFHHLVKLQPCSDTSLLIEMDKALTTWRKFDRKKLPEPPTGSHCWHPGQAAFQSQPRATPLPAYTRDLSTEFVKQPLGNHSKLSARKAQTHHGNDACELFVCSFFPETVKDFSAHLMIPARFVAVVPEPFPAQTLLRIGRHSPHPEMRYYRRYLRQETVESSEEIKRKMSVQ